MNKEKVDSVDIFTYRIFEMTAIVEDRFSCLEPIFKHLLSLTKAESIINLHNKTRD